MDVKALPAHSLHPPRPGLLPACAAPARLPLPGASPSGSTHQAHLRQREEGRVAAVEKGAADHLQDEGGVLQREHRHGRADGKAQAEQGR